MSFRVWSFVKFVFPICFFIHPFSQIYACDVCGCAPTGNDIGLLSQKLGNMTGLRWNYFRYTRPKQNTKEFYHTLEWWGRLSPHKKVQILSALPLHINRYNQIYQIGIGDFRIQSIFEILHTNYKWEKRIKHKLQAGVGLRMPTGKFEGTTENDKHSTESFDHISFQIGTGSVSFNLFSFYTLKTKKWGITTEIGYQINTVNSFGYLFGNHLSTKIFGFYFYSSPKINVVPSSGIAIEHYAPIRLHKERINGSDNLQVYFHLALELHLLNTIILRGQFGQPLYREKWISGALVQQMASAGISYIFKSKKKSYEKK